MHVHVDLHDSFAALTRDGRETGMGITPYVREVQTLEGIRYDTPGGWNVTHLASGLYMAGPFDYRLDAQSVASRLASTDWTRPMDAYSDEEKRVTRRIIQEYTNELPAIRN